MNILRHTTCLLLFIMCSAQTHVCAQLYTQYANPNTLDSMIVQQFAGNGVEIYNVQFTGMFLGGADGTQPIRDIGFFDARNTTLGIDSGIILSTGFLNPPYGLGINSWYDSDDIKNTPGDTVIDTYIAPLHSVDATILEFDFIPNGDSIKFNYVFASDEYPGQNCGPDVDAFFFHISGPGIIGQQNIALVPGTSTFVGVGTINNGIANGGANCQSLTNTTYYVDRAADSTCIFNGSTTVLTATAATIPCEIYHIRFSIADVTSRSEDGAVFLQANSFNSEPISIVPSVSYAGPDTLLYEYCGSAMLVIRRTYNLQLPKTYTVQYSGTATYGADYAPAPTTLTMQSGEMYDTLYIYPAADFISDNGESLVISVGDTLCNGEYFISTITMLINEKQGLSANILPHDSNFCDTATFTVTLENAIPPIHYNWNNGATADSTYSFFQIGQHDITVQVTDGCGQAVSDTVTVNFGYPPVADFSFTPTYPDLLNPEVSFIDNSSANVTAWLWEFGNGVTSTQQHTTYYYIVPDTYTVSLIVTNDLLCMDTIAQSVVIHELPTLYVPNSFTPNGDHINDIYHAYGKEMAYFTMRIFDRWGNEIYAATDMSEGWNGQQYNKECPAGVYVVQVTYAETKAPELIHTQTERITLIR